MIAIMAIILNLSLFVTYDFSRRWSLLFKPPPFVQFAPYVVSNFVSAYTCVNSQAGNGDWGRGCSLEASCCQYSYVISGNCPGSLVCCYKDDLCGGHVGTYEERIFSHEKNIMNSLTFA